MKKRIIIVCVISAVCVAQEAPPKGSIVWAASQNDLETVKKRIQENPNSILKENSRQETALDWASSKGNAEIARLIVQTGDSIGKTRELLLHKDGKGISPLQWAISQQHPEVAELLLKKAQEAGLIKDVLLAESGNKKLPTDWAAGHGFTVMLEKMLNFAEEGAFLPDVLQHKDEENATLLMRSVIAGSADMVKNILSRAHRVLPPEQFQQYINARARHQRSSLHYAVRYAEGSVEKNSTLRSQSAMAEIIRIICSYPALDPIIRDDRNHTAMYWAAYYNQQELIAAFRKSLRNRPSMLRIMNDEVSQGEADRMADAKKRKESESFDDSKNIKKVKSNND